MFHGRVLEVWEVGVLSTIPEYAAAGTGEAGSMKEEAGRGTAAE